MAKRRALIVDDEAVIREVVKVALASLSLESVAVACAKDALALARTQHFDLLLTDYLMPGMNGLELLETLHKEKPELPILLMTAYGSVDVSLQAVEKGARGCLLKPFNELSKITLEVEKVLRRLERGA